MTIKNVFAFLPYVKARSWLGIVRDGDEIAVCFFSGEETMAWIFSGKEGLQAANDDAAGRFSHKINDGLRKYAPDDDQGLF